MSRDHCPRGLQRMPDNELRFECCRAYGIDWIVSWSISVTETAHFGTLLPLSTKPDYTGP